MAAEIQVENDDSKDTWNRLNSSQKDTVFRELMDRANDINRLFPQQIKGLNFLELNS